jgi:predicted NAD/FAD-dependent oxidoreductase
VSRVLNTSEPVVVVGAGLAGLVAAGEVAATGRPVILLEQAASVGGRLATWTADGVPARATGNGSASTRADLGAQFFTVRSEAFGHLVDDLVAKGIVYEWCRGFNEVDGFPRFAAHGGMRALAEYLAEQLPTPLVDLRTGHPVEVVAPAGAGGGRGGGGKGAADTGGPGRWRVAGPGWEVFGVAVLLTCPVPESLALLSTDSLAQVDARRLEGLRAIDYHRVLAVAAVLDRPSAVPPPGARQLGEGPFSFVADNAAKGVSARPVVTLHVAHDLSADRWEEPTDRLLADLLRLGRPWLGDADVLEARLERWRWSGPVTPWPDRYCEAAPGLVLAGDAFGGPKVEGAYLSGAAAGTHLAASGGAEPPPSDPVPGNGR